MNDQQVTAEQAYEKAKARVIFRLAVLKRKLRDMNEQVADSPDWADVGDLNRIVEQLERITEGK